VTITTAAARVVAGLVMTLACAALALGPSDIGAQARTVRLPSKVLGETRVLHISVPANYKVARQRYPVVVLLDGQARPFFDLTVASVGYNLVGDDRDIAMPSQIVVGVEQGDRASDLSRNDVAFTTFLTTEVLPYIDREYRTLPYRTLIGHSLGGRFALLALCRAPTAFSATIAISPSLPDSVGSAVRACIRASAADSTPRMRQLVVSAGSDEPRMLPALERFAAFLRDSAPPQWRTSRVSGEGMGHTDTPFATIPAGLRFVFASSAWEVERPVADSLVRQQGNVPRTLDAALARLRGRLGAPVEPSAKWMTSLARYYLARGPADSSIAVAKRMVQRYPEELQGYALLADAHLQRLEYANARKALADAMSMLDRLEWFDETQKERQRVYIQVSMASIPP
jgi:predicted alpha/beta superfamily hydrolase